MPIIASGTLTVLSEHSFAPVAWDTKGFTTFADDGTVYKISAQHDYDFSEKFPRLIKRTQTRTYDGEVDVVESTFEYSDVPSDDVFYLKGYGLPEPDYIQRKSSGWLYIALAVFALISLGVYFKSRS